MVIFVNLAELIVGFVVMMGAIVLLVVFCRWHIRQKRCKHASYHETGACDAVCNDCGKNLGFIGRIRTIK